MELDAIWQTFAETGDPVCYMLYKTVKNQRSRSEKEDPEEETAPRAQD